MYIIVFWHYVNMYFFYIVYINIMLQIILFFLITVFINCSTWTILNCMANRTAAFGALLAWRGKSPIWRTSFLKNIAVFVRWNKLLLSKGTVVLYRNYNATLHFKFTAFHLTKMGVTHITVAYLLQNSLTTKQNRVHLTRSNCFSLVWHSRKISNNIRCSEV